MRFTKPAIASLVLDRGKSELIVFDDALPGFGIRIRAGGKRTWIAQYRIGKLQRRLTLGRADTMGLAEAREHAKVALAKAGLAIDPQAEKSRARAEAAVTVGKVVEKYLTATSSKVRASTLTETTRYLRTAWSGIHSFSINAVDRSTIATQLTAMASERGPVAADRARAALSAMFSWAMREGIATSNPVALTNRHSDNKSRNRVLADGELREVWLACREDDYGFIVKLLMLTGQRLNEVGRMRWGEVDAANTLWSLSEERTKNGRPHSIPLSDQALAVLTRVPKRAGRDLLFGSGDGPFSGWTKAKAALDGRMLAARRKRDAKAKPLPHWTLHDLRRTFATRAGDLGIPPHIVEAVLNHLTGVKAGVAGVYNRSLYATEKRTALITWGDHVAGVLSQSEFRIIPLRR
jgi:integrase